MFNEDQEDEIRNLLTVVVLYFQRDTNKEEIDESKSMCKDAINKLIKIMKFDGNNVFYKKEKTESKEDKRLNMINIINNNPFFNTNHNNSI